VPLKLWPLFVKEQKLVGSYGRNRKDIVATLDWAARGKIKAATWKVYPLSQAPEAFAALRQRQVLGKAVVDTTRV
jgi:D-arabinose 1-dehydrogenase-like Zn-dependent alcohol dehydrogenase